MDHTRQGRGHQPDTAEDLGLTPSVQVDALYLHVPFCFHKCHYCDFYSIASDSGQNDSDSGGDTTHGRFTEALLAELNQWANRIDLKPNTIFVGGGTPTMLEPSYWRRLLERMHETGVLERITEFTVEANPETVTDELLDVLAAGGVNRLSIGAQSFEPDLLRTLERHHSPASVPRAVEMARRAGIDDINLDLIFAIPGQSLDQQDRDLEAALACEPTHLACYGLIFEPGTALTVKQRQGRITPMDEQRQARMYEHLLDRLDDAGFEQYEISNWAKPGRQSRRSEHNLHYWHNDQWLGLGPSAASHLSGIRWRNQPHLGKYLAHSPAPPIIDHEQLDEPGQASEQLMLGLRLTDGIDRTWFQTHFAHRQPMTDQLITLGLLEQADTRYRLTRRGLLLADSVIGELM